LFLSKEKHASDYKDDYLTIYPYNSKCYQGQGFISGLALGFVWFGHLLTGKA
jgi:hypothetical protein